MTYTYQYPRPALTVDVVLFSIQETALQALLIQRGQEPFKGKWALPGGFVRMDETLEAAAKRELKEETNLPQDYLEQVYTFGDPDRDPRGRVVTVAYFAILRTGASPMGEAGSDAASIGWFPVDELPPLAFDHAKIIHHAVQKLRSIMRYSGIALLFLPSEFTLSDVQRIYDIIFGDEMGGENVLRRLQKSELIEATGRFRLVGDRSIKLYRRGEGAAGKFEDTRLYP